MRLSLLVVTALGAAATARPVAHADDAPLATAATAGPPPAGAATAPAAAPAAPAAPASAASATSEPAPAASSPPALDPPRARFRVGGYLGLRFFDDDGGLGRGAMSPPGGDARNGIALGGRFAWQLHPWLSVEGELDLLSTSTRLRTDLFQVQAEVHGLVYLFEPGERFRPLGVLGVGTRAQLSEDDTLSEDATIVFGSLGIGVEIALAERWGARVDARMLVGPDLEDAVGAIDGEVLFAVYYDLGQAPGTRRAEPPAPPPLPDDADRDGLDDELDRCPDEAEDTDGHEDDDGCPEREEDVDGDGDGVLGSLDRCPKAQETANSFQDDDGCPDELPAAVQPFSGTIDGITFERGSTRISRSSYPLLDAAARALADNPKLRVVVVGHTDDRGKRERNIEVSLRRAEAVKKYLVKKGIAADRIGTMGLGPDQPIDDNGTKEGRARNRRIEFKLSMEP